MSPKKINYNTETKIAKLIIQISYLAEVMKRPISLTTANGKQVFRTPFPFSALDTGTHKPT